MPLHSWQPDDRERMRARDHAGQTEALPHLRRRRPGAGATVCLFGPGTLKDDWVRWTLAAAQQLRHPVLGAPFSGAASGEVTDLLASIGAEIVPLRGELIAERLAHRPELPRREPLTADALATTLRLMKHPLR